MTTISHTILPTSTFAAPRMLLRRTFHPYGKEGPAFSVTLRDSREGPEYLFTQRNPGTKAPMPLFQGRVVLSSDLDETAAEVLEILTRAPGDDTHTNFQEYTPEQLDFAVQHGRILRQVVGERLAWNEAKVNPRMDLKLEYKKRKIGDLRHRFRSGVVDVSARTRKEGKEAFEDAVRNHLSALPSFARNASGSVYALFPRGSEWVIQPLHPGDRELLGEPHLFAARSPEEAESELARAVNAEEPKPRKASGKLKAGPSGPPIGVRA